MGILNGIQVPLFALVGGLIVGSASGKSTNGIIYAVAAIAAKNAEQALLMALVGVAVSFAYSLKAR